MRKSKYKCSDKIEKPKTTIEKSRNNTSTGKLYDKSVTFVTSL